MHELANCQESIVWNKELLYISGVLCRVAYEVEMLNINSLWKGASEVGGTPPSELRDWLQNRCLHALRFFSFYQSTPSAAVSSLIEAAFFGCSLDGSLSIISTTGIMDVRHVRIFDPAYSGFLKVLPVLPAEVASEAKLMVDILRGRSMLKEITFTDVLEELRSRALTESEMVECLKWRIALNTDGIRPQYLTELRREFLNAAIFITSDGVGGSRPVSLATTKTVHIPRNATAFLPSDGPFPEHTLPFSLSRQVKADALYNLFGWIDLTVSGWLENVVTSSVKPEFDLAKSPEWAEKVLNVLSRAWQSLPKDQQTHIVALLQDKALIPTKQGMKKPRESYFLNAKCVTHVLDFCRTNCLQFLVYFRI